MENAYACAKPSPRAEVNHEKDPSDIKERTHHCSYPQILPDHFGFIAPYQFYHFAGDIRSAEIWAGHQRNAGKFVCSRVAVFS